MIVNAIEYLEKTAARVPQKQAVLDRAGEYSFEELRDIARKIATAVGALTSDTNEAIAVYLPKSKEALAAFLGILYSGNCYAPLDTKSPTPRTASILDKLQPKLVITDSRHAAALSTIWDASLIINLDELPDSADEAAYSRFQSVIDTDPIYVIHTSGSTGAPKGVTVSHRGVVDYIEWAITRFNLDDSIVIGNQAPLFFDNSTLDLFLCFSLGATLVLIPEEMFSFPMRLMEYVSAKAVSFIFWVPSVMIGVANQRVLDSAPISTLRYILFAGEVMPNRQLNVWRKALPDVLFANLYGPTEITVDCTYFIVDREFADEEPLPIGFACRNTDILLLTADSKQAASGEVGELCVRGSSLALGYWNNPEKTSEAFVQNPLQTRYPERIYRTGDLVKTNERGEIIFIGRVDSQIKHLGYRIELGEIETAVMSIADIQNCCAVYDTGRSLILLYFQSSEGLSSDSLRANLLKRLPKYMVPSELHRMEELPLTPNGKVDRVQLQSATRELASAAV